MPVFVRPEPAPREGRQPEGVVVEVENHLEGATCWVDLATSDIDLASAFYADLLGWEITEGNEKTGGYRQALVAGRPVAGLMPVMDASMPTMWTQYLKASDEDAQVARAIQLGATVIVPPMDVLSFGRMAVLLDPTGAGFGLWQPDELAGSGYVREPGSWTWSELVSSNPATSEAFYTELLGWTRDGGAMPGDLDYRSFAIGADPVAAIMARPPGLSAAIPDYWGVYFTIESTDRALEVITTHDASVVHGPETIPVGTMTQLVDPTGAMVGLLEPGH